MSNICSDKIRQAIANEIIDKCQPAAYADVGCYQGSSMTWWREALEAKRPGQFGLYGCDINVASLDICKGLNPLAQLQCMDSLEWLRQVQIPEPVVFYLDTDWRVPSVKGEETDIIFERWQEFVIIANSVNEDHHPLAVQNAKPWRVTQYWGKCSYGCNQFLAPLYSYPVLENGYVVVNCTSQRLMFDRQLFLDFKESE